MIDFDVFKGKFTYYFTNFGITFDEKILRDFYIFTEYLICENEKYNLTAITDIDDMIQKHYIDSVSVLKYFDLPENSSLIDIGAGAGFPSVPLYIMRNDLSITFLDSSNKKINFIKNVLNKLECKHENVFICSRAEDTGKDIEFREKYDFAVSRAVAKLNILCELAVPFIKSGGYFISYKSKNSGEEIKESENAIKVLDLHITETVNFNISQEEDNKRILIKIKKLKKTSPKYPRSFSNISKNPL
ncbi:MAG: 16S rRNA (guanine(527)-N(7))-methyltransferase RsmG [Oscillospiraceae bacterium]|nr:16S rRNA (guanine(527)-N(7))-methyltransferase RsmG [Oscillospiraceae bacterium]